MVSSEDLVPSSQSLKISLTITPFVDPAKDEAHSEKRKTPLPINSTANNAQPAGQVVERRPNQASPTQLTHPILHKTKRCPTLFKNTKSQGPTRQRATPATPKMPTSGQSQSDGTLCTTAKGDYGIATSYAGSWISQRDQVFAQDDCARRVFPYGASIQQQRAPLMAYEYYFRLSNENQVNEIGKHWCMVKEPRRLISLS